VSLNATSRAMGVGFERRKHLRSVYICMGACMGRAWGVDRVCVGCEAGFCSYPVLWMDKTKSELGGRQYCAVVHRVTDRYRI
jgi:hypothetical protein